MSIPEAKWRKCFKKERMVSRVQNCQEARTEKWPMNLATEGSLMTLTRAVLVECWGQSLIVIGSRGNER